MYAIRSYYGRQGEPGESRFFISLEDELIRKYELVRYMPSLKNIDSVNKEAIQNISIISELHRGRKIIEGYNSDIRRQLWKYTYVIEEQRRIIYKKRLGILTGITQLNTLSKGATEKYQYFKHLFGERIINKVEKQITLYYINKNWAQYLNYISYIRRITSYNVCYTKLLRQFEMR